MRVDKFLNIVNITKRRAVALDMCKNDVIKINGVVAKAAKEIKIGDIIEINYLKKTMKYEVLAIPEMKSMSKSRQAEFIKEIP